MAARLPPFRVPKGVPSEIRRALRLPRPGRFLSTEKAFRLADALVQVERLVQQDYQRAYKAMERARTTPTREKWVGELRAVQQKAGAVRHGLDVLERAAGYEPLPPLASPSVKPVAPGEEEPSADYFLPEEGALEWEIGVDYTEEVAGAQHRRTSDVTFNARLYDPRGGVLTESQVREAMDFFASEGELSYKSGRGRVTLAARSVNWANWKGDERQGRQRDLENFRSILQTVGDKGLRVGGVKPDRL